MNMDRFTPGDWFYAFLTAVGLLAALYVGLCQSSPWP
jgi:hypothetical protein